MHRKTVPITGIKTADLPEGTFEGWASTFGNVDHAGDRVVAGAFAKSLARERVIPLNWEHRGSVDPRALVGQVVKAEEVSEGLHITGQFDLDTEFGSAAYRAVKSRRAAALSIGYVVNQQTKAADGVNELIDLDLIEVSVVARPANDRALITASKSVDTNSVRARLIRARVQYQGATMTTKTDEANAFTKGRDEQLALAKAIVDSATELQRDLTGDEADAVEKHLADAAALQKSHDDAMRSKSIMSQLDAMAAPEQDKREFPTPELGENGEGKCLVFGKAMAQAAADKIMPVGGAKALAPSGAATVGQEFAPSPVALGRPANSLLSVMPVKQHSTPEFSYLRATTRTNNAAIVADYATKPTSVNSIVRVEDSLDIIAHLSEGIPRYWLVDNSALQQWLSTELAYGLEVACEAAALATINATSGIQTQAYSTSVLQTLRKSLTKLEVQGYEAGFLLLNPTDWEGVELALSSTNAIEHLSLPYDAASRRLFGVPVVTSNAQAAGVSHAVGKDAIALDTDEHGVLIQYSENATADSFAKNLVFARCEMRAATSVYSPLAVVVGDLTA